MPGPLGWIRICRRGCRSRAVLLLVGAYLIKLQEEIDKWNETTGAEEGVYIELISNINTYATDLEALMQAGTFFDLIDVQTNRQTWIERGWVKDLETIENEELQALIESYEPYIQNGINIQGGMLFALPLEVVPIKMAVNLDLFEKNNLELPETWTTLSSAPASSPRTATAKSSVTAGPPGLPCSAV